MSEKQGKKLVKMAQHAALATLQGGESPLVAIWSMDAADKIRLVISDNWRLSQEGIAAREGFCGPDFAACILDSIDEEGCAISVASACGWLQVLCGDIKGRGKDSKIEWRVVKEERTEK